MSEQVGVRGFIDGMKREGPNWAKILPQLPRLLHDSPGARMKRRWQARSQTNLQLNCAVAATQLLLD